MKEQKQIRTRVKYRRDGKEKYVQNRSLLIAAAIAIGQSIGMLFKGGLTHFSFLIFSFVFVMSYIGAYIGTTFLRKRNEKKYNTQENDIE
ncbi:MAG: hypothetical protein GX376_05915 [Firmicutes bacterium]|nr:hypothetical protein [Bacillota bacterium]